MNNHLVRNFSLLSFLCHAHIVHTLRSDSNPILHTVRVITKSLKNATYVYGFPLLILCLLVQVLSFLFFGSFFW